MGTDRDALSTTQTIPVDSTGAYLEQPILTTPRLIIRPFTPSDASAVQRLAGAAAVAEMTLNIPHPYPDGAADAWIASHQPAWDDGTNAAFAVVTPDGDLRGAIGLHLNHAHRRGELGYWVGEPFWGQGIATEAVRRVVRFVFEELALNRVQASHLPRNPASGRVMQKVGMTREGLHRERYLKDGRFEDVIEYAILRRDWEAGTHRTHT